MQLEGEVRNNTIETDECVFGRKNKTIEEEGKGNGLDVRCLSAILQRTRNAVSEPVTRRDRESFFPIIKKYIKRRLRYFPMNGERTTR